jgi:thioredoxin-related protein
MDQATAQPAGKRPARDRRPMPVPAALLRLLALAALTAAAWTPLISIKVVRAAELVMFESPLCEWCEAWDRDVGVVYHKTEEGRLAPLRRVELHAPRPEDLGTVDAVVYTPTFVLVERGRELGRITGYPGEDHFWGLLGVLLEQLRAASGT